MEEKINFIEPLLERAEQYGKTSYQLFRLKALYNSANVLSGLASRGSVFVVISIAIAIANIGVSLWLGDVLGKLYHGFFCVAGFYSIVGFVLYFFLHNRMKKSIANSIISKFHY